MKRLILALWGFSLVAGTASAQYAYTSTTLSATSDTVYASTYTEVDYYTANDYSVALWSEIDQDCQGWSCAPSNRVTGSWASGSSSASWSGSAPLTYSNFTVRADPEIDEYFSYYNYDYSTTFYEDVYGYSLVDIEGGTPDIYTNAPEVYVDDVEEAINLDPAFSVIDGTTNPPFVSALQLWSGDTGPGDSGYWILYGNDLADIWGTTTASIDCPGVSLNVTYASPTQVNIGFAIDGSVPVQTCNLSGWNPFGAGSIPANVGFPFTPVQHNYPRNPLPNTCHIAQFFDKIGYNGTAHHALDLVYPGCSAQHPELCPPYGTPVYAMEAGTVYNWRANAGPANPGYPYCQGLGVPGDNLQVQGSDGYITIYYHMNPQQQYTHAMKLWPQTV